MNKITKRSFYSFLALYLISSFLFLTLAAYWFFSSQVAMEKSANFYKMNHIAETISSQVINAHMNSQEFRLGLFKNESVALLDEGKKLLYGSLRQQVDFTQEFYMKDDIFTLVAKRTAGHLDVEYVVVQSEECAQNIMLLKNKILYTVIFTAIFIIIIAIFLSYMFLKPIKDKMLEIENFVRDTTHELNTPITALMMSASRIKNKKHYDEKIINNISISTKQLYEIYSSLSYLSFDHGSEDAEDLDFKGVAEESINYFGELLEKKNITLKKELNTSPMHIAPTKAKMLINNLLSNAIKYSKPNTTIYIKTDKNGFLVKDEGIGIAKEELQNILKMFVRANSYAGGFGVGLNIVDSIVKEQEFVLNIESKERLGTKVSIKYSRK
ncbi:MAG: HAMP domain-containing sensor histidine kinase [Campylobacterota bacterium]|nr:HAMP domain-containing sensor histidine kinase [Campylobacterota bacterium]